MGEHELSAIPREARPFQGSRAGVVTRVLAAALDSVVVAVALVAAYVGLAGFRFLLDPRGFHFPDFRVFTSLVVVAVVLGCYLTVAWSVGGGRTYGNLVMGLRVVTPPGSSLGWFRAAVRAAGYLVLPIGIMWVALDRRSRSLQDI